MPLPKTLKKQKCLSLPVWRVPYHIIAFKWVKPLRQVIYFSEDGSRTLLLYDFNMELKYEPPYVGCDSGSGDRFLGGFGNYKNSFFEVAEKRDFCLRGDLTGGKIVRELGSVEQGGRARVLHENPRTESKRASHGSDTCRP